MAKVYTGCQVFYAEFDVSGDSNSFEPDRGLEILESRPFNSAFVKKDAGMTMDSGVLSGYLAFEDPGTSFMNNIGTAKPVSVCLEQSTAAEGDRAYLLQAHASFPDAPAAQGQLRQFTLNLGGTSPIAFGYVLGNGNKTSSGNTASGVSTAAVADGQSIFAAVHCTAATSGTVDIIIESAATGDTGFSSPTTRLTFTQITTTATSEWQSDKPSGGITDTLWRAKWTGASTPDHTFCVTFGIV